MRTCNLLLNHDNISKQKFRVCLEYHIGNCKGPCAGHQSETDYQYTIQNIRRIIKGHYGDVLRDLKKQMHDFSEKYAFEEAQSTLEKSKH